MKESKKMMSKEVAFMKKNGRSEVHDSPRRARSQGVQERWQRYPCRWHLQERAYQRQDGVSHDVLPRHGGRKPR
jgi:hypothetical protein